MNVSIMNYLFFLGELFGSEIKYTNNIINKKSQQKICSPNYFHKVFKSDIMNFTISFLQ